MLSVYDDGSTLSTDPSGAVVAATDNQGNNLPVTPPDGGITQSFSNLVTYGVQAIINNRLPPAAAPATGITRPGAAPAPGAQLSSLFASPVVKVIALVGLGWFIVKKVF